jgi:hypothetical protein
MSVPCGTGICKTRGAGQDQFRLPDDPKSQAGNSLDDYAAEVNPCGGTMLAFRRNERSYHGFHPCSGERRTAQMYWVEPNACRRGEKKKRGPVAKFMKRLLRKRR